MQNWGMNILLACFFFSFFFFFLNLQCECEKSLARVWMQHKGKHSQIVLLGRCLEFHLSKAIMKIEVMQMNKRIAFGRCVIVLYPCHTPPKKVYNQMYLVETTALLSICGHSFAAAVKKRKADSRQSLCCAANYKQPNSKVRLLTALY